MAKKLTIDEFIKKSKRIHNNKYDYSKSIYVNVHTKLYIICHKHGGFFQDAHSHMKGHGCPVCANEYTSKLLSGNAKEFIKKANIIHNNKYDYSKIDYVNRLKKITICCKLHGDFLQQPYNHLNNHGCPKCAKIETSNQTKLGLKNFIIRANQIHKNKYDYSTSSYKNIYSELNIICPTHGQFSQIPHDHLYGAGCPKCNASRGELAIINWLKSNNINFIHNKKFKQCKNPKTNYSLRFDFYIPRFDVLIEFDGMHHSKNTNFSQLNDVKYRDKIKNEYCIKNRIRLLRIPYTEMKNIEKILNEELLNEFKKQ